MDVSEGLFLLMGSAIHEVIARAGVERGFQEERIHKRFGDFDVSGKADLWEEGGLLTDWKFTSVWAVIKQDKKEWEAQVNCYAHLYRYAGFPVYLQRIYALLRDWRMAEKRRYGADYPDVPFIEKPIPIWDDKATEQYIKARLAVIADAIKLKDEYLPLCTPEERWTRDEKWAVMKTGRQSAVRLCHSEDEAQLYIQDFVKDTKAHYVEHRPGYETRCLEYCDVREFCPFYKEFVNNAADKRVADIPNEQHGNE